MNIVDFNAQGRSHPRTESYMWDAASLDKPCYISSMVEQALEAVLTTIGDGSLQCLAECVCYCLCGPCMDKMCPPKKAGEENEEQEEGEYTAFMIHSYHSYRHV